MTQSKFCTGRKRMRTGDEEAQLSHPAPKRRDINPNRDLHAMSALSIHASNGVQVPTRTAQDEEINQAPSAAGQCAPSGSQHFSPPSVSNEVISPYTNINMLLKQAHLESLQRQALAKPD